MLVASVEAMAPIPAKAKVAGPTIVPAPTMSAAPVIDKIMPFRPRAVAEMATKFETRPVPSKNAAAETMHMSVTPAVPMKAAEVLGGTTLLGMPALPAAIAAAKAARVISPAMPIGDKAQVNKSSTRSADAPLAQTANDNWPEFEALGLGKKPSASKGIVQKLVVSTYRLIGFAILTLIVVVLLGYIATTVFFYVNESWVMPVAVSQSDEKIVALKAQLAQQQNVRDRLAAELDDTDRAIAAQQDFQSEFAKAIASDLRGRQAALGRVRQLASQAAATQTKIRTANDAYADDHADKMAKEFDAGLIDRSTMLAGKYQLAQISTSNLSLSERQADFETRARSLSEETRSLDAVLANKVSTVALSYDVLKIKRDYDQSKLELARAIQNRKMLQTSIGRQDDILKGVQQSTYLRVIADKALVAQVPYDNLKNVSPGTKLFSCKLKMVWCREVGEVIVVLPGEVSFKHPHRDSQLRGQLVELRLTDPDAAAKDVLFLGSEPVWF